MNRKGFTLIELLVVIAIIAILAAILFPVFAQAKVAAKKAADLSNVKQIGTSTILYLNDYDDTFYPHRNNCQDGNGNWVVCQGYLDGNGNIIPSAQQLANSANARVGGSDSALSRYYYVYMLQPYTKNYDLFKDPNGSNKFIPGQTTLGPQCTGAGCIGAGYGGQNSYGHNDVYLSPAAPFGGGGSTPVAVNYTSVPRVASTIVLVDSTYYGAAFDAANESGLTDTSKLNGNEVTRFDSLGSQYRFYWKNIGNSNWSFSGGETGALAVGAAGMPQKAIDLGKALYGGNINANFADSHAKSLPYAKIIGDVCLWTTDADGSHPACG